MSLQVLVAISIGDTQPQMHHQLLGWELGL